MDREYDVIIVGAGAAGLFAAASFGANNSLGGLILNKAAHPGLKLLMSGNGQCNLTHGGDIKEYINHYGQNGKAIRSIIYKYNNESVMEFFESHGVSLLERPDGKVFPKSMKASDVCGLLLGMAEENGFELANRTVVTGIEMLMEATADDTGAGREISGYKVLCSSNGIEKCFSCRNLIIAAGGRSYPTTGSDGSIFDVLENLGIEIAEQKPALVPVFVQDYPYGELSGVSFKNIELTVISSSNKTGIKENSHEVNQIPGGKENIRKLNGDLLFTHTNLSGPVILDNSRYIETGSKISINYLPGKNAGEVSKALKKSVDGGNRKSVTLLLEYCSSIGQPLPKRLLEAALSRIGVESDFKAKLLTGAQIDQIAGLLTADKFSVSGLGSYNCAMSTAGGIRLQELQTKSLEFKKYPHLYAIGEVLDVDGDTGGYNLQFAFSSAHLVAKAIESDTNLK